MAIFELFSKRNAKRNGAGADVYQYDQIPDTLRVQIIQIVEENFLLPDNQYARHFEIVSQTYERIVKKLRREKGVFQLPGSKRELSDYPMHRPQELFDYLLKCSTDDFLDALELICLNMYVLGRHYEAAGVRNASSSFSEAIEEVNYRLQEAAVGYQYTSGELIRVDSQFLHSDAVIPALAVLKLPGFEGAQAEFLKAHEHYRHKRNAEALNECYKAFESVMKAICDKHRWEYDKNWAAARLVDVCIKNGLIPTYYQSQMTGLRTTLESAIPTPRNKTGAHGAGSTPVNVPDELASYVIHVTAATLLYLATLDRMLR